MARRTAFQDAADFIATLADGDYMIDPPCDGAYGISKDATYITVRSGQLHVRYQDLWCGGPTEGQTYRQHRNGVRAKYPARLSGAKDITVDWEAVFDGYPQGIDADMILDAI